MTRRTAAFVTLLAVVPLLLSGCMGGHHSSAKSSLVATPCPDDVRDAVVGPVACAFLTVPESRTPGQGASNRRIKVFVAVLRSPGTAQDRDPILVPTLASTPNYGGVAPLVQRTGRDVIIVDTRGVGHSQPTLDCPGVDASLRNAWSRPTADTHIRTALLHAVGDCRDTLVNDGVDVTAFDIEQAALDLEDLRAALGVQHWIVASYGDGSRLAFELLRIAPERVDELILDSPGTPQSDPRALAGPTTEHAIRAVLSSCADDPGCRAAHPGASRLLDRALASLDAEPLKIEDPTHAGHRTVLLDGALLMRGLRQMLTDSSRGPLFEPASVPDLLTDVVQRRVGRLTKAVDQLVRYGDALCLGYRPKCLPANHPALGVELSVLCRDIAPQTEHPRVAVSGEVASAFDSSPWRDLCRAWPADPAPRSVDSPPTWSGPVLVALGKYDPYTPQLQVRHDLAGLTNASYVEDPAFGYNVMSRPCLVEVRNRWLDNPHHFDNNPCAHLEGIPWND